MAEQMNPHKWISNMTPSLLTNANMNLLRSSSAPATEFITVLAEPFNAETAKSCPILGNVDQPFSSETPMDRKFKLD